MWPALSTGATQCHLYRFLRVALCAQLTRLATLGISPSLLRKMRLRGPADPLGSGPAYIRLSPSLIVYEISALDAWLDARSLRADTAA